MEDEKKTKRQLIAELHELRQCVTELKGCKEEFEQTRVNQEKFTKAFLQNSIPMGITTLKEGRFVDVSDAFLSMMGRKRDEVVGHTSTEIGLITEDQRSSFFAELNRKGRVENHEMKVKTKGGEMRHGLFNAVMMSLHNEQYLLTVMTDITERKQTEEALHRSETKFRTLYDSTGDAVMLADEQGFIDCNKTTLTIFGCATSEEFCRKHPADLSPPQQPCGADSAVLANRMIATAMEKGSSHFEWMHKRSDTGKTFHADVLLTSIELDGRLVVQAVVRDITERKLAEEKSQNMLNFLQTLINTIPSPIFCKDINGLYQDCNKEFEDYTGFKKEEVLGKSVYDIYPMNVADKYHKMDLALFRQPGRQIYEHPIIYADGKKHDVVVNKATYVKAGGTLAGLVGVMVDITERKQAEEELRKSEERYRLLADEANDVVYRMKIPEGIYEYVSPSASRVLGYTQDELYEKPMLIQEAIHPEWREYLAEQWQAVLNGEEPEEFEFVIVDKQGNHRWNSQRNSYLKDGNGKLIAMQGIIRNITEQKRLEENLKISETKYRLLVETLNEGIWQIDKEAYTSFANTAMAKMLGYTVDEMLGKHLFDFMDEHGVDLAERNIERRKRGLKERHDFEFLRKDGTRIYTSLTTKPIIDKEGNYSGTLACVHDITDRKLAEDELGKYREGLEQLVAERTQELENKTKTLEEVNIALKVLLQHRDGDRKELEDRFVINIRKLILPFMEKMKNTSLDDHQLAYLNIIETHLKDITSSMIKKFNQFNLTPKEVEVASLIKEGKATKEIAGIIGIATSSINTHRINIRKKLGISKENVNLRSHLQSFD